MSVAFPLFSLSLSLSLSLSCVLLFGFRPKFPYAPHFYGHCRSHSSLSLCHCIVGVIHFHCVFSWFAEFVGGFCIWDLLLQCKSPAVFAKTWVDLCLYLGIFRVGQWNSEHLLELLHLGLLRILERGGGGWWIWVRKWVIIASFIMGAFLWSWIFGLMLRFIPFFGTGVRVGRHEQQKPRCCFVGWEPG